jgi:hypothetical protein
VLIAGSVQVRQEVVEMLGLGIRQKEERRNDRGLYFLSNDIWGAMVDW